MPRKVTKWTVLFLVLGVAAPLLFACGGGEKEKKGSGGGEEVKRELGEAYEATREYLGQKKSEMAREFDRRLKELERDIDVLREKAAVAGESGREKAEEALEALKAGQKDVRRKLEEYQAAGEEMKEEAARRLEEALQDLDEAYLKARERYGSEKD